jgi:hypothetical protein
MANLNSQNIGLNYKGILNLNTLNGNLSGTLQAVTDGDGNASPLTLSTGEVGISRTIALGAGATNVRLINETYTINNSGAQTGTATGIFLNATETALNGMAHNLIDLQMNSTSRFVVSRLGVATAEGLTSNGNILNSSGGSYQWVSRSRMNSPADGVITILNNGSSDFNRLQLGGTTNAFPAIKRNGAAIEFVLADGSAQTEAVANSFYGQGYYGLRSNNRVLIAGSLIRGLGTGVLGLQDSGETTFSRLVFGLDTNAFPAIKRNGAAIDFRLADDSGSASISANIISGSIITVTQSWALTYRSNNGDIWATLSGTGATTKVSSTALWNFTGLPTTRPATVGDLYVDTAANILANGDKIVAIRV